MEGKQAGCSHKASSQESPVSGSVSEIPLSEISLQRDQLLRKAAPSSPQHTWMTLLKKELEFLGVTQILVGLLCFSFGTIAYSFINISEFEGNIFSSFRAGYPFWGAIFFGISGLLSIICERKTTTYLVQGRLGTNIVSTIAAGTGIFILIINLKASWSYLYGCPEADENDTCFAASFSTEFVAMLLFLTILELCCTVSTIIYGIGDLFKQDMVPEDRVYEDLNIYSPIYSELEENVETRPPADS
ncbi:high affinity immunoglobulin epsilon receptor subunit beta [Tenrec ecaudatus]|uniref:high affinity immunoglobulin epsilon receptor subunit beta n=1 Tax=Tenrec ecaudatus TaxID=94439 RepID=UPI003F59CB8D